MRLIADIGDETPYCRAMIFGSEAEAYLFLFKSVSDGPSDADLSFGSVSEAKEAAARNFGILDSDWSEIADPLPGQQHDVIGSK